MDTTSFPFYSVSLEPYYWAWYKKHFYSMQVPASKKSITPFQIPKWLVRSIFSCDMLLCIFIIITVTIIITIHTSLNYNRHKNNSKFYHQCAEFSVTNHKTRELISKLPLDVMLPIASNTKLTSHESKLVWLKIFYYKAKCTTDWNFMREHKIPRLPKKLSLKQTRKPLA